MSSEVKWIKIVTDIFDDEKILLIESMPDADAIIVIWFKLLCLAGKQNNDGVLIMNNRIPYNDEMFAHIFRRPLNTVRMALKIFEQYGMIEIINNTITISNWGKHQQMDALERKREYQRNLMAKRREKQKMLALCDTNSDANVSSLEEDKEGDKEILTDSKESVRQTQSVRRVVEAWNALGLSQISKITSTSNRGQCLNARIKEYGIEKVLEAIERIRKSSFLRGQSKSGWTIKFDWLVKPNNFPKVLEGQYDDKSQTGQNQLRRSFREIMGVDNE